MKTAILTFFLSVSCCFSAEPVLDYKNSLGGIATVAGHVNPKTSSPLLITVRNGGLSYSTVTDSMGHWGIVFRHLSTQFDVSVSELGTQRVEATLSDSLETESSVSN